MSKTKLDGSNELLDQINSALEAAIQIGRGEVLGDLALFVRSQYTLAKALTNANEAAKPLGLTVPGGRAKATRKPRSKSKGKTGSTFGIGYEQLKPCIEKNKGDLMATSKELGFSRPSMDNVLKRLGKDGAFLRQHAKSLRLANGKHF